MKTIKIASALLSISLIFFMSTTSIAGTYSIKSADGEKTMVNKETSSSHGSTSSEGSTPALKNEFSHLRFAVSNFFNAGDLEVTDLPSVNEFEYLRFDVNKYDRNNQTSEMPADEFGYLRFDVNKFVTENPVSSNEMPAR